MAHARLAQHTHQQGVYSGPQYLPIPQGEMVQASAGIGEYQDDSSGFRPLAPFGASPDGIGHVPYVPFQQPTAYGSLGSPLLGAIKTITRGRGVSGLGDDGASAAPVAAASGLLIAAVVAGLAITGVSGYYVGKAVAPSHDKESQYAWWGVFAALVGGPIGLGIESAVALSHGRG